MAKIEAGVEINDSFIDERVLVILYELISLFSDYANYLVSDVVPPGMNSYQR